MSVLYMTELSESFFITLIATVSAIITLSLRMILRSRCSDVSCFCFRIHRDVDLEAQEAMHSQNQNNATMDEIYRTENKENIRL